MAIPVVKEILNLFPVQEKDLLASIADVWHDRSVNNFSDFIKAVLIRDSPPEEEILKHFSRMAIEDVEYRLSVRPRISTTS